MISDPNVVDLLYLVSIVCFVLALRFLSSPKHARKGNWLGGAGMIVAIATTLLLEGIGNWLLIVVGAAIGSATKMPMRSGLTWYLPALARSQRTAALQSSI